MTTISVMNNNFECEDKNCAECKKIHIINKKISIEQSKIRFNMAKIRIKMMKINDELR